MYAMFCGVNVFYWLYLMFHFLFYVPTCTQHSNDFQVTTKGPFFPCWRTQNQVSLYPTNLSL